MFGDVWSFGVYQKIVSIPQKRFTTEHRDKFIFSFSGDGEKETSLSSKAGAFTHWNPTQTCPQKPCGGSRLDEEGHDVF
jgi:hypothetical protein